MTTQEPEAAAAGVIPATRRRRGRLWTRRDRRSDVLRTGITVAVGFSWGLATFWLQGVLPSWIHSIANSASGWSLVAITLVVLLTDDVRRGALIGVAAFLLLNIGYGVGARIDGLYYDMRVWGVVAVIAGPVIGAASAVLRRRGLVSALSHTMLGGLFVVEGARSLVTVQESTSSVYWAAVIVLGVGAIVRGVLRADSTRDRLLTVAFAGLLAGATWGAGHALEASFHWL